jgi:hypothetical protein
LGHRGDLSNRGDKNAARRRAEAALLQIDAVALAMQMLAIDSTAEVVPTPFFSTASLEFQDLTRPRCGLRSKRGQHAANPLLGLPWRRRRPRDVQHDVHRRRARRARPATESDAGAVCLPKRKTAQ